MRTFTSLYSRSFATEAAAQQVTSVTQSTSTGVISEAFGYRALDGLPLPRFIPVRVKDRRDPVSLQEAIKLVQSQAKANFDETVEIALKLGIDPRRGDQMVRGATVLPHGTGKTLRVCVFAKDEAAEAAKAAGGSRSRGLAQHSNPCGSPQVILRFCSSCIGPQGG